MSPPVGHDLAPVGETVLVGLDRRRVVRDTGVLERGREPLRRAVASGPCHRDAWPDGQQAGQGAPPAIPRGAHVLLEPSAVPVRAAEGAPSPRRAGRERGQVDELALQKQREPLGCPTSDVLGAAIGFSVSRRW